MNKFCVEVFCSESGWKKETWINRYNTKEEAKAFVEEIDEENKLNKSTPEIYYLANYLGEEKTDQNGNIEYEHEQIYNKGIYVR